LVVRTPSQGEHMVANYGAPVLKKTGQDAKKGKESCGESKLRINLTGSLGDGFRRGPCVTKIRKKERCTPWGDHGERRQK